MKFSIQVGKLLAAVETVATTVDKKGVGGSNGIFVNAYRSEDGSTQALFLYTTNLTSESTIKIDAPVEEGGRTLLDPDQLRAGLMRRNPEDTAQFSVVVHEKKERQLQVKIGKSKFHLGYDPTGTENMSERMRKIPFRSAETYKVAGKELAEFVRRGMFCIPGGGEGQNRLEISGMKLLSTAVGYEAHATDGHVAARIVVKGEKGPSKMEGVLIPHDALPSLSRIVRKEDEIKVIEGDKNASGDVGKLFFKVGDNTFFGTRLLTGRFPDVAGVLKAQKPEFWFTVDREELKHSLERSAVFDDMRRVDMEIEGTALRLSARSSTTGKAAGITDELEIQLEEGTPEDLQLKLSINLDYLKNVASGSSHERLKIGVSNYNDPKKQMKALIVEDFDGQVESTYAIMPMRV